MVETGQDLALILESIEDLPGILTGTHKLEGNHFLIIVGPECGIHLSHPAHPDLRDDLVGTHSAPNPEVFIGRNHGSGRRDQMSAVEKLLSESFFRRH